jgi:hypothetical protein
MKKFVLCCLLPPAVACRVPCYTTCAAPISVVWLAAVCAIVLGLFGGPTNQGSTSWQTIALGGVLWLASSIWAYRTTRDPEKCAPPPEAT